jgi:hypothetical protein
MFMDIGSSSSHPPASDDAAERRARLTAAMAQMVAVAMDVGTEIAQAAKACAQAGEADAVVVLNKAMERAFLVARRAAVLEMKIAEGKWSRRVSAAPRAPRAAQASPASKATSNRELIWAGLGEEIERLYDPPEREDLMRDLREQLDDIDIDDLLTRRTLPELVRDICAALVMCLPAAARLTGKSFLVLFFKKELLR